MYIADMHCDSLARVSSERGLRTRYNFSYEHPQLQFVAEFIPRRGESPEARRRKLMHLFDVYIAEQARLDLVPIHDCQDLNFAITCERSSSILAIEGGGGLFADSDELTTLYRAGLRVLGIAWDTNELATSSFDSNDNGLTPAGRELVTRASEMGIILDVSHLSDRSTEELLELTPYPVIATHSNLRSVCDVPRNLPDSIARKICARGGVMGISLYPGHLRADSEATLDDVIRHVDYALEHFGEDSLGFGFDIDGTDGKYPHPLDESESIHDRVIEMLSARYGDRITEKIAGENVINFLKANV